MFKFFAIFCYVGNAICYTAGERQLKILKPSKKNTNNLVHITDTFIEPPIIRQINIVTKNIPFAFVRLKIKSKRSLKLLTVIH